MQGIRKALVAPWRLNDFISAVLWEKHILKVMAESLDKIKKNLHWHN